MDLSRWKLPRFSRLTSRYRSFQDFFASVLEGENAQAPTVTDAFSVDLDYEKLWALPPMLRRISSKNKNSLLLERLVPFFEAGFLLKSRPSLPASASANDENQLSAEAAPARVTRTSHPLLLRSMFVFGKSFNLPRGQEKSVRLNLPPIPAETVLAGRVRPVLKAFDLEVLLKHHEELLEAQAFAFSLGGEMGREEIVVLICNRPHPWQMLAIEAAAASTFAALKDA